MTRKIMCSKKINNPLLLKNKYWHTLKNVKKVC